MQELINSAMETASFLVPIAAVAAAALHVNMAGLLVDVGG
jgi:hypothetical protein